MTLRTLRPVSLPMHPYIEPDDQDRVAQALKDALPA